MVFSPNDFRSSFVTDVAHSNLFKAIFYGVPTTLPSVLANLRDVALTSFRVKSVELPGKQLVTQERQYSGIQKLVPYSKVHAPMAIEVIEDDNYLMRKFFDAWQSDIHNDENVSDTPTYTSRYYDEIVAEKFVITAFNAIGIPRYIVELRDVFPVAVNPSQMSWDNENQITTIPVELAYREWRQILPV